MYADWLTGPAIKELFCGQYAQERTPIRIVGLVIPQRRAFEHVFFQLTLKLQDSRFKMFIQHQIIRTDDKIIQQYSTV